MKPQIFDSHQPSLLEHGEEATALLEARSLSKRYTADAPLALDDLALRVFPREIYCLLGANGAGKTTSLNLFLGYIRPSSGAALVDGVDVQEDPLRAKSLLGYVPENVALYGEFTALENLDYFASLGGRDVPEEEQRRVLKEIGLPESAFRSSVRTFSKGMRQKLGIAIAMVKGAPAVLLDEPTTGLDPESGREFIELLKRLRGDGKAILMSTHDIFRVRHLADRVGIMNRGRLVAELDVGKLENQDVDTVRVGLKYSGKQEERQLYLEKDPSANKVRISSPQFSLEGDLGGDVTYKLRLERFTASVDTFRLTVHDLPSDVEATFLSDEGASRINQIRFGEGETVKSLDLQISLPERAMPGGVKVGTPTPFFVVLEKATAGPDLSSGAADASPHGKIQLELLARGVGKLEVLAVNLYQEVFPAASAEFSIQIRNSGTRRLGGVRVTIQAPADWDSSIEPPSIPALEVDQQSRVKILLTPPRQAPVGDYPIKIEALASTATGVVQSENKTARLRVVARPDIWSSVLVYGLLLALLALLVIVGVRLTRR